MNILHTIQILYHNATLPKDQPSDMIGPLLLTHATIPHTQKHAHTIKYTYLLHHSQMKPKHRKSSQLVKSSVNSI